MPRRKPATLERPSHYIEHVKALLTQKGDIPCARKGQLFEISSVCGGVAYGVLGCGHPFDAPLTFLTLLEPLDKLERLAVTAPPKTAAPPPTCDTPVVANHLPELEWQKIPLSPESVRVHDMTQDDVQVFGYYVFTRQLHDAYKGVANSRDKAAELELDPSYVPDQPEERTCVSNLLTELTKWLRPKKIKLSKVRAKSEDVCYKAAGETIENGQCFMYWTPEAGLTFDGAFTAAAPEECQRAQTRFVELKQTLTSTDWSKHLRNIFLEKWNGFPARQGGVVYWVAPNDQDDMKKLGALLAEVTGLGLVAAPCLAGPIAYSMIYYGAAEELAGLRKRKQADATLRATRQALIEKINRGRANAGIPTEVELDKLMASIQEEIEATPTGTPESNKPNEKKARKAKETKKSEKTEAPPAPAPAEAAAPPPPSATPTAEAPVATAQPEVAVPWEESGPTLPPAPGQTVAEAPAPAPAPAAPVEEAKVKRTIVLNGNGQPPEIKTTVEPTAPPAPAPAPAPETALPPPAPALPPPPPAQQPDATLVLGETAYPLKYEGAPAEGMHAYAVMAGEPQPDTAWAQIPGAQMGVYYCWLAGKLYTSQPLG